MNEPLTYKVVSALEDFRSARRKATLGEIMARLRGEPVHLLSYDDIRSKLKAHQLGEKKLHDIPLKSIVGSVNRYEDFTRDFLPRGSIDAKRWAGVSAVAYSDLGLPPIEVYQIGEAYFVSDGNHRVSVARSLGSAYIQAYVTEVSSRVAFTPDMTPDELIIKTELAGFLDNTLLYQTRPQADLTVTAPGQYQKLEEHISIHRYYMGQERKREINLQEAAAHWYDQVFLPVTNVIRSQGLMKDFPGRTETDLYLWIAEHRAMLEKELGVEIKPDAAAIHLARQRSQRLDRIMDRIGERVKNLIIPDALEAGPPTGEWRLENEGKHRADRLFSDILVAINGKEDGWSALDQAILVAQNENGRLQGLHVVRSEAQKTSKMSTAAQQTFHKRTATAGIVANLAVVTGEVSRRVIERSAWNDVVVINLAYPPVPNPLIKFNSGIRNLILRCPRPILLVPHTVSPLKSALLAYDGSPKSKEALYVATYLAGQWRIPLAVVTVGEDAESSKETILQAETYLQSHGVDAKFTILKGAIDAAILIATEEHQSDFIIMGGYGTAPLVNFLIDDVVDLVLRKSRKPMLLCR